MTCCLTYFGSQQIFADVYATIAEEFWQQITECKWTVMEKLRINANINYHEDSNTRLWIIQGNMHQLSQAQNILAMYLNITGDVSSLNEGNSLNFSYIPPEFHVADINESVISKPQTEDKAITCDIIKTDHRNPDRYGHIFQTSSTVAALNLKEKYKAQQKTAIRRKKNLYMSNTKRQKILTVSNVPGFLKGESVDMNAINVEFIKKTADSFKFNLSKHQVTLLDANLVSEEGNRQDVCEFKNNSENYKFSCKKCSFKSNRESHLAKHLRIHDKVNTLHACDKCNFTTIRLSHLRRHAITHSQTVYNCDFCTYKSNELKLLARHMKVKHTKNEEVVTSEVMLSCSCCSYKTTKPYFYQRHLKVHFSDKKLNNIVTYHCDKCDYKTNRREHYIRHVNDVHTNRRPFLCDFCGKAFKRPDALKQHKQTHEEPVAETRNPHFKCNICQKKCRSHASLREHLAVHSNERSFLCEICGASFKTRSVQRKHVITIHKNPRSYSCQRCEKRFNTNFALRRHLRLHQTSNEDLKTDDQVVTNENETPQTFCSALEKELVSAYDDTEVVEEFVNSRDGVVIECETVDNEIHMKLSGVVDGESVKQNEISDTANTLLYIPTSICDIVL